MHLKFVLALGLVIVRRVLMNKYRVVGIGSIFISVLLLIVYLVYRATRAFPFLWLPIVLFLSIGITCLVWPRWQRRHRDADVDDLLLEMFPRTRAIKWTMLEVGASAGFFLFGVVFWWWETSLLSSMLKTAVIGILIGISIVLGLHSLFILIRHDDRTYTELQHVLSKYLNAIVWVYEMPFKVQPEAPVSADDDVVIYIWLDEGVVHSLLLSRPQIRLLFTFLRQRAPQATFGYNLKLAQIYQEPERLPEHYA
ncbi:MAG: hypothetical protein KC421_28335 [Anaerolineales bacterium]|nr:hypothetical protein [Anaerolineales bacterium]